MVIKTKKIIVTALFFVFISQVLCESQQQVRLTAIVPNQNELRVSQGAVGSTYRAVGTIQSNALIVQGRLGVGTTSPERNIHAAKVGNLAELSLGTTPTSTVPNNGLFLLSMDDSQTASRGIIQSVDRWQGGAVTYVGSTIALNPFYGGNVGIGTDAPAYALEIESPIPGVDSGFAFDIGGYPILRWRRNLISEYHAFYNYNATNPHFAINETGIADNTLIIFDQSSTPGAVMIGSKFGTWAYLGKPTLGARLYVCGDIRANGYVYALNGNPLGSDLRWKTNIETLNNPIDKIMKIRGVEFDWRRDEFEGMNFPKGRQIGIIAQELEKEFPELIHTDAEGYKSIDYGRLTAVLIEAIKAQQREIDGLREEIREKKGEEGRRRDFITQPDGRLLHPGS